MQVVVGSPGTWSGLLLRAGQCVFAGASIGVMLSASGFSNYTAFCLGSLVCYYWVPDFMLNKGRDPSVCPGVKISTNVGGDQLALVSKGFLPLLMMPFAFSYLIASMGLQALWSLGLACLDVYALRIKRDLHNPVLVSLFVVGDWVTATLSLAAACSSAGVTVLFVRDVDFCRKYPQLSCSRYEISIVLAFLTWLLIAVSSLVMFWLLASV